MNYRELWILLKETIDLALDEAYDCGYDKPSSEYFGKYVVYQRIRGKMEDLEKQTSVEPLTEKMRNDLEFYCEENQDCKTCDLKYPVCRCSTGVSFTEKTDSGDYAISDAEIRFAYNVAFERK